MKAGTYPCLTYDMSSGGQTESTYTFEEDTTFSSDYGSAGILTLNNLASITGTLARAYSVNYWLSGYNGVTATSDAFIGVTNNANYNVKFNNDTNYLKIGFTNTWGITNNGSDSSTCDVRIRYRKSDFSELERSPWTKETQVSDSNIFLIKGSIDSSTTGAVTLNIRDVASDEMVETYNTTAYYSSGTGDSRWALDAMTLRKLDDDEYFTIDAIGIKAGFRYMQSTLTMYQYYAAIIPIALNVLSFSGDSPILNLVGWNDLHSENLRLGYITMDENSGVPVSYSNLDPSSV